MGAVANTPEPTSTVTSANKQKNVWFYALAPIGGFVGLVILWGIVNLIADTENPSSLYSFFNNVLVPLLFGLLFLAIPVGIIYALYSNSKSKQNAKQSGENNGEDTKSTASSIAYFVIFIIVVSIGGTFGELIGDSVTSNSNTLSSDEIFEIITLASEETNKQLPMMADEETEVVRVFATQDNKLNYRNRLITTSVDDVDWSYYEPQIKKQLSSNYCNHPDLEVYREHNIPMKYHYYDKDDMFVGVVEVSNVNCN